MEAYMITGDERRLKEKLKAAGSVGIDAMVMTGAEVIAAHRLVDKGDAVCKCGLYKIAGVR